MDILLTGGSGKLGKAILAADASAAGKTGFLTPAHEELDITLPETIRAYLARHPVDTIIHCAALARMGACEASPRSALNVNAIGTANLAAAVLVQEKTRGKPMRFVHISTDAVYAGIRGNYSETDPTIPYNTYGWSKLAAEAAVRTLPEHCIIRTSFFDPRSIPFTTAATDAFTSKIPIAELARAVLALAHSPTTGVVNVGQLRISDYDRLRKHKLDIRPTTFAAVAGEAGIPLAQDASLDVTKWTLLRKTLE